jgi:hypothetical protein
MMLNLLFFLLGLAFTEAILKPIIVLFTQRQIRKYVPIVLDRLDPILPEAIRQLSETELREKVISTIFDVGVEFDEKPNVEAILDNTIRSYSFLVNARKTN